MTGDPHQPLTASEVPPGITYGKAYLDWKGWDEENFARVGSLDTCYFDAEFRRAGLKPNSKIDVLEVGFGNGSFLAYAKNRGWNAIGSEINDFLVQMAKHRSLNAVHADDLGTLQDCSFDLIVAFDVLEHISADKLLDFVQSLIRLLRPSGYFLARFPNADSPFGLLNQNGDITHLTAIGLGKVRYLAQELDVKLAFFGGQAVPVICGDALRSLRRFCGLIFFSVINAFVNTVFFPNDHIAFCSSNVVMILQTASKSL